MPRSCHSIPGEERVCCTTSPVPGNSSILPSQDVLSDSTLPPALRGATCRSENGRRSMELTRMAASLSRSPRCLCCRVPDGGAVAFAAGPALVVDVDSGKVLHAERATDPWFPASITKLMTTYVALDMVRRGEATMDQLLTVTEDAAALPPSKMALQARHPDPARQRAEDHHGQVGERHRRDRRRQSRRLDRRLRGADERRRLVASA